MVIKYYDDDEHYSLRYNLNDDQMNKDDDDDDGDRSDVSDVDDVFVLEMDFVENDEY